jgi:hypothetical protein
MLLVSVPYLLPWHTTPIPSFYTEWWAGVFGLLASLALVGARRLPLPGFTLLALLLGGIVLLQEVSGRAPLPQLSAFYGLYLLWAALLASASSFLVSEVGQEKLTRFLALALCIGSLLAALLSLVQPWLLIGFPARLGGLLGQANHFTSYIWLGLASLLYLHVTAVLSRRAFWLAAALLTLTAVLVGQRSSFLYAAVLIGIAFWQARNASSAARPDPRPLALGIGLMFVFLQPFSMLLPTWGDGGGAQPPPALRAFQQASGPSIRLQLWRVGWAGIAAEPLFGNGVGSYPSQALTHAETIPAAVNPGPAESAHNLFIDLSVEFGVPVALLVLIAAGGWLWRVQKAAVTAEGTWAIAIFLILCLHGLIEYSLWYSYFFGLLAVVAGAFGSVRQVGQRLAPVALTLGLLLWGGLTLVELRRDYKLLETSLALGKQPAMLALAKDALLRIPQTSLLSPWVNTTACVSLDPLQVAVKDGLAVCRIAMHFAPAVESGVHQALLQWRAGDADGARTLLRDLRLAMHYNAGGVDALLVKLAARDARISELFQPE